LSCCSHDPPLIIPLEDLGNRAASGVVQPVNTMDFDLPTSPPADDQEHQWMLEARCRGRAPHDFFPSDGVGVEQARKVCADCPVKEPCLEYALTYRIDHGVWGGASERERRRILRRRRYERHTATPIS